jgi:hypothetical protein
VLFKRATNIKKLSLLGCHKLTNAGISGVKYLDNIMSLNVASCRGIHDNVCV